MLIKQSQKWSWYQGSGVHSCTVGCLNDGREQCTCQYHITDGVEQFSFDTYLEAESKWCELTNTKPFRLGKDKWNNNSMEDEKTEEVIPEVTPEEVEEVEEVTE